MENGSDFLEWVGPDMSACVFRHLDDPADLIRSSSVSRLWNNFVISNSFVKNLCIRLCPEVSHLVSNSENDHNIYMCLIQNLVSNKEKKNCILKCIAASSTDRPEECIENTLESKDYIGGLLSSYWSSKGEEDPEGSETLTYRLVSHLCIVDEIKIQPYLAFFNNVDVYSAKFVCFKMGCYKVPEEKESSDNYAWFYTSPEFPMQKEYMFQSFKLPRPVLCIGGVIQIHLIGRAHRCSLENLYFIRINHVEVIGRPICCLALSVGVSEADAGDFSIQYSISEAQSSNTASLCS